MRSWLESKRRFGTGYASDAGMSGLPKVKGSQHGVRNAKARTGTNRDKTSALWRLAQNSVFTRVVVGDGERM
jgi:hypothetical protein